MSVTDNKPVGNDVRARLQRAALELYRDRGYDETTAAQVAERAGVTERTFFRHFVDKREVLFGGEPELLAAIAAAIVSAPPELGPLDALRRAVETIQPVIEDARPFSEPRHELIWSTPALRERELTKRAAMVDAAEQALIRRGTPARLAALSANAGVAAFLHAVVAWFEDPGPGLTEHLDAAFDDLRMLSSGGDGE